MGNFEFIDPNESNLAVSSRKQQLSIESIQIEELCTLAEQCRRAIHDILKKPTGVVPSMLIFLF